MSWVVALLASVAAAKPLKLRWWQNEEALLFDVDMSCMSTPTLTVGSGPYNDTFRLSCEASVLEFDLRELVDRESSQCSKRSSKRVHCSLLKQHPHFFDRLSFDADALRGVAKADLDRWQAPAADEPAAFDYNDEPLVRPINTTEYQRLASEAAVLYLDVAYPWCTHCTAKRMAFAKAARALSSRSMGPDAVVFGVVDALEERALRSELAATCSWSCSHYVLRRGEPATTLPARGEWEAHALEIEMRAYLRPPLIPIESATQLAAFRAANRVSVIGSLDPATDAAALALYDAAARELRSSFNLSLFSPRASAEGYAQAGLYLHREAGDGGHSHLPPDGIAQTNLSRWVRVNALDTRQEYSWEVRTEVEALRLPVMHIFVDDSDAASTSATAREADATLQTLSDEMRGKVAFLWLRRSTASYMLEDFAFVPSELDDGLPVVGISLSFDYDAPKFGYRGELSAAPLREFVNAFFGGRLKVSLKSATPPNSTWQPGQPMVVVGSTLQAEVAGVEGDVLLCLHPPLGFTGPGEKVHSVLERLSRVLAPLAHAAFVAKMDAMENAFEPHVLPGVEKYAQDAQLMLLHTTAKGRTLTQFKASPSLKALLTFLKKHSVAVRTRWPEVKAALDQVNADSAAKKVVATERARAELAERRKQLEGVPEEVVCCGGDRGVVKAVLRRGHGAPPPRGSRLRVHYTGRLVADDVTISHPPSGDVSRAFYGAFEGTEFDSSIARGEPFEFTLGQGMVISGWEHAFASMLVGERALLRLTPSYGYGEVGSPPKIPPSSSLEFDVELLEVVGAAVHEPKAEL